MDHPRSSSGRYWKSEFDVYHDETEQAMRKLKKYKQAAKSFARAKDSETVKLSAKLREERSKVTRMEAEISQLAADLAKFRPDGPASDSRQAELMAKLTTRTARTVERQRRVDELQATLEERSSSMEKETPPEFRRVASPRTSKTIIQASEELKKARKQVQELLDLRAEMSILRMKAETAGNRADKLEKENVTLRRDLADTRKMLSKSGKGRMEGEGGKGGGATECSASAGKEDMERLGENQRGIPEPQHIPKRSSSERGPDLVKQNALPRLRGVDIPADRAAAALARLEQRRAERKKLRAPRPEATG
ncbi:MAG: hypothetical protein M1826_005507 [Phylliscum demangeonii]|nr:MAG: hypothetical protein M1826_005507 [Phylliscum demangeonii]